VAAAQAQAKGAKRKTSPAKGGAARSRLRKRIKAGVVAGLVLWLLVGYLVVRPGVRARLEERFCGRAHVAWAVVWPTLDVSAYGVTIVTDDHRLAADRLWIDVRTLGIFGSRPIAGIDVDGLELDLTEGKPLRLLRESDAGATAAGGPSAAPSRVPRFRLHDPRLRLGGGAVFDAERVDVRQVGDRTYAVEAEGGSFVRIPFEMMTARVIPGAGHLLVDIIKLRAFNGLLGGVLDVHLDRAGAFNGEAEWHLVEAERIWATYGLPYAEKRRGDFSGEIVFRGDRPALRALSGTGSMRMRRAAFFSPLSFRVFLTLKIPVAAEARLTSADLRFSFEDALFYLESGRAQARNFMLDGRGILSFDGGVDIEVEHAGTTVAVSGQLDDPTIKVLPLSHVTLPFDRIFRERVGR
jgi:hypothetical protein